MAEALQRSRAAVGEAFRRYRRTLYPLTLASKPRLAIASQIVTRWESIGITERLSELTGPTRLGFFDGGSRGNLGPGDSGSVWVEFEGSTTPARPVWAAATVLGRPTTTNNVAEFVELHRLLTRAVEKHWREVHVVGDSAFILGMIERRQLPKARKLQHWYRPTRRLADICEVATWTHHYRKYNKMADWLANYAMDKGRNIMVPMPTPEMQSSIGQGVSRHIAEDTSKWREEQGTGQSS